MKITLITYPQNNINEEIKLLKTALLYADKVDLCSFTSSGILPYLFINNLTWQDKINVLENLLPFFETLGKKINDDEKTEFLSFLTKLKGFSRKQRRTKEFKDTIKQIDKLLNQLNEKGTELAEKTGVINLKTPFELGNLNFVELYDAIDINDFQDFDIENVTDSMVERYSNKILKKYTDFINDTIVKDAEYPMFDTKTSKIVLNREKINSHKGYDSINKEFTLMHNLFQNLPTFENFSIDEILDIRKELNNPLIRFRSGLSDLSEKVDSIPDSNDFKYDVDKIYRKYIADQILEIEESIKENSYLRKFMSTVVKESIKSNTIITGAFGFAISNISSVSLNQAAVVGGSIMASKAASAYLKFKENSEAIKKNKLFFYYKLKNL
ncbi:hypothetical protein [Sporosalibacterium faouarense]|uniref:hypothetical protein n=1 Tax=Sporosalibacterium faouarense TaxID=516123 RepID=UPI00192C9803|nr:hypothetical protein [Sporosalibacterium faouarense]